MTVGAFFQSKNRPIPNILAIFGIRINIGTTIEKASARATSTSVFDFDLGS